jgi:hypothetical protein
MNENLPDVERKSAENEAALPTPEEAAPDEHGALKAAIGFLLAQGRRGANWFFWIAALSLVNSAIIHLGGQTSFLIGLAITQIFDGLAVAGGGQNPNIANLAKAIAIGFDILVAAIVAGFGWLSLKRYTFVFGLGMFLYLLDGLLFLLFQDFLSAGFHAFALFAMWRGLRAYHELNKLQRSLAAVPTAIPSDHTSALSE